MSWQKIVKQRMERMELGLKAMAQRTGVNCETLRNRLRGASRVKLDEAEDMALVLEMSPQEALECFFPRVAERKGLRQ